MSDDYIEDEFDGGIDAALDVSGAQRTPCVLVLDTSSSMRTNGKIDNLNAALKGFEQAVNADEFLRQHILLAVIGFGSDVSLLTDWTQADEFSAPTLEASGLTSMGEAMRTAHDCVEELRQNLKSRGTPYTRPWIFLMSDGGPNDDGWQQAAAESRDACENKRAVVWPLAIPDAGGVPSANAAALQSFARSDMQVYEVAGDYQFDQLFEWLGTSLGALANSTDGQLQLTAPGPVIDTGLND
ncbi:MAG: VWA domain-containing protein [Pseudomonadota bacterium]